MKRFIMIGVAFAVLGVVMSNIMLGKKPTDVVPDVSAIKNIEVPEIPSVFSRLTSFFTRAGSDSNSGGDLDSSRSDGAVSVYKWQDSDGNWHFDDKPQEGFAAEQVVIEVDNVLEMEMPKMPEPEPASSESDFELGSPYSPGAVKDLMDNARGVEGRLEEREAQQQQALDNL